VTERPSQGRFTLKVLHNTSPRQLRTSPAESPFRARTV
jgi:hypothetical protein